MEAQLKQQQHQFAAPVEALKQHIERLHYTIMQHVKLCLPFDHYQREMNSLKARLASMEATIQRHQPQPSYSPYDYMSSHIQPPSLLPKVSQPLSTEKAAFKSMFGDGDFFLRQTQLLEQERARQRAARRTQTQYITTPAPSIPVSTPPSTSSPPTPPPQLTINLISQYLQNLVITKPEPEPTSEDSDASIEHQQILLVFTQQASQAESSTTHQTPAPPPEVHFLSDEEGPELHLPRNPPQPQQYVSSEKHHLFIFDDCSISEQRNRIHEMTSWCNSQLIKNGGTTKTVILDFISRMTGSLREWWLHLREYRQLGIIDAASVDDFMFYIYSEFLGGVAHVQDKAREEFFQLKCCSFKPKDLDKHFKMVCQRFYLIGGLDDPNLKQAYLNQLPEPLGAETLRYFDSQRIGLSQVSLGDLYQQVQNQL